MGRSFLSWLGEPGQEFKVFRIIPVSFILAMLLSTSKKRCRKSVIPSIQSSLFSWGPLSFQVNDYSCPCVVLEITVYLEAWGERPIGQAGRRGFWLLCIDSWSVSTQGRRAASAWDAEGILSFSGVSAMASCDHTQGDDAKGSSEFSFYGLWGKYLIGHICG